MRALRHLSGIMNRAAFLVAGVVAILVGSSTSAYAHQALVRSSPAAGASLAVAPREIQLTFYERPERLFTRVVLIDPSGAAVELDSVVMGLGNTVTVAIRGSLVAGAYVVQWQSAGRDGHVVQGDYEFSIIEGAPGTVDAARPVPAHAGATGAVAPAWALRRSARLCSDAWRWIRLLRPRTCRPPRAVPRFSGLPPPRQWRWSRWFSSESNRSHCTARRAEWLRVPSRRS